MTVDNLYLQNLEEYILDEGKIVTYKWLSKTLEVHVNQAKQMLYTFVQQERNKGDNDHLNVTYFVSGLDQHNGVKTMRNQIVPEERLEVLRSRLDPLTSCHVYSVHKTKVKDTNALYMSDLDIVKEQLLKSNKFSAIRCTSAKLRSSEELSQLKSVAQPTTNAPSFNKPTNQSSSNGKPAAKNKPSSGIAGMFAATDKKKDDLRQTKKSPEKTSKDHKMEDKTNKASKTAKSGGIGHFFGNQASKPKKEIAEIKTDETQEITSASRENTHNAKNGRISQKKEKSPSPKVQPTKSRRKKREDSDDDGDQIKKRRRIKESVWSDSSDEEQEMETEPQPPTPPPSPPREPSPVKKQPSPSPVAKKTKPSSQKTQKSSPQKDAEDSEITEIEQNSSKSSSTGSTTKRRKRQKKLVSKTFMDDSGFMVTEKVYESCSESASDEDLIPPTPPVKPARQPQSKTNQDKKSPHSKKSPASAAPGKQSTLMSFFKKK